MVGPHFLLLAPKMDLKKDWKSCVWNSTPNLQERIADGVIPNSLLMRDTAWDGGWDWPPGKGPNTALVGRESPASGEQTVGAPWECPGLSFGLLDEVTVSAWLWDGGSGQDRLQRYEPLTN